MSKTLVQSVILMDYSVEDFFLIVFDIIWV